MGLLSSLSLPSLSVHPGLPLDRSPIPHCLGCSCTTAELYGVRQALSLALHQLSRKNKDRDPSKTALTRPGHSLRRYVFQQDFQESKPPAEGGWGHHTQGRDAAAPIPPRSQARHSRSFHAVLVVTATAMAQRGASGAGSAFLLPARLRSASASYGQAVHRGCPARPAGAHTRSRRDPPERRCSGGRGLTADEHHETEALGGPRAIARPLEAAGSGGTGPGPSARRRRPTTGPPQQPRAAPGGCPGSARRSANRERGRGGCHGDGSAAATRRAASWRSPAGAANEEAAVRMGAAILRGRPEGRGLVPLCRRFGSRRRSGASVRAAGPFPGLVAHGPPTAEAVVPH